jgi:hypothetical protein
MRENQNPKSRAVRLLVLGLLIVVIAFWFSKRRTQNATDKAQHQAPPLRSARTTATAPAPSPSIAQVHLSPEDAVHALVDELTSEADAMRRDERLEAWLNEIAYSEIPEFISSLDHHPASKLIAEIKLRLFRKLAGNDPAAAARLASQQADGPDRQRFLKAVAVVWSGLSPDDAIAWARELPQEQRGAVLLGIANETIATDPRRALELAREIPAGDARNELVARVAGEWATRDPQSIATWAEKIEEKDLRESVLGNVAVSWADTDPAKAAELAVTSLSPGKTQNDAVVGVVQRWAQIRPSEAGRWVSMFRESELRDVAARELVSLWTDRNARDAGEWVNGLPAGAAKDAALSVYVGKIANTFPETAIDWVSAIPDVDTRNRELERVATMWLEKSPATARQWIGNSSLPQPVKDKLLLPAR